MKHPIRREFMLAALEYIKTEDEFLFEFLNKHFEHLAEHLVNILDVHGVSIINACGRLKKRADHIFKRHGKRGRRENVLYGDYVRLPDGRVIKTS